MVFSSLVLRSSKFLITILGVVLILRIILAGLFPLTGDEGYYWLWSRDPALSYVDHPPMIALINAVLEWIFREPLVALRAGAAITTTLVLGVLFLLSKELAGDDAPSDLPWRNLLLFLLVPNTLIVWLVLTVELPFVLFYLCALLNFVRFIRGGRDRHLYWTGVFAGLGLLTKYTMVLLFPVIFAFVLMHRDFRHLLRRRAFWLSGLLAMVIFAPTIIADARQGSESLLFHAGRIGAIPWFAGTISFFGDQILYLSPFLVYFGVRYLWHDWREAPSGPVARFLMVSAVLPFVFFLGLSAKTRVWPHWPAMAYGPLVLLVGTWLSTASKHRALAALVAGMAAVDLLVVGMLLLWSPGVLHGQRDYRANYALAAKAREQLDVRPRTRFASDSHSSVAQLTYYGKVHAFMPTRLAPVDPGTFGGRQFDRWNTQELVMGDDLVILTRPGSRLHRTAQQYFASVEPLPDWRLTVLEAHEKDKRFYLARGFTLARAKF